MEASLPVGCFFINEECAGNHAVKAIYGSDNDCDRNYLYTMLSVTTWELCINRSMHNQAF